MNALAARRRHPAAIALLILVGLLVTGAAYAALAPKPAQASTVSAAQVEEGKKLYGMCTNCHGSFPRAPNIIPDLRRSGTLTSAQTWKGIVIDGVLEDRGMVSFKEYRGLTDAQAEAIRAYVASEAVKLKAEQMAGKGVVDPIS